jgi:hypothetical protein
MTAEENAKGIDITETREEVVNNHFWSIGDVAVYFAGPPTWRDYVGGYVEVIHVGRSSATGHDCATIRRLDGKITCVRADATHTNIKPTLRAEQPCEHCEEPVRYCNKHQRWEHINGESCFLDGPACEGDGGAA